MEDFANETACWLEDELSSGPEIECELGSLIAAASACMLLRHSARVRL